MDVVEISRKLSAIVLTYSLNIPNNIRNHTHAETLSDLPANILSADLS